MVLRLKNLFFRAQDASIRPPEGKKLVIDTVTVILLRKAENHKAEFSKVRNLSKYFMYDFKISENRLLSPGKPLGRHNDSKSRLTE